MKIEDLKKKSISDLHKALKEARGNLSKLKIEVFEKKEKNVRKIGILKKDIARIKTLLSEEVKKNG
ncbi:50S ribosomal protein L29 [Patescibacteria group bacterium]|nr:50S ribosomal protein L29 [Patescibacteria group bacterium]